MKLLGLWDIFVNYMDSHCVYSDPTLNSTTVFIMNAAIIGKLFQFTELHNIMMEVLKVVVPTNDGTLCLLRNRQDEKYITGLTVPLTDSKLFQLSKAGKLNVVKPMTKCSTRDTQATKKSKGKAKAKPVARKSSAVARHGEVKQETEDKCAVVFLQDVQNTIDSTLEDVQELALPFSLIVGNFESCPLSQVAE